MQVTSESPAHCTSNHHQFQKRCHRGTILKNSASPENSNDLLIHKTCFSMFVASGNTAEEDSI